MKPSIDQFVRLYEALTERRKALKVMDVTETLLGYLAVLLLICKEVYKNKNKFLTSQDFKKLLEERMFVKERLEQLINFINKQIEELEPAIERTIEEEDKKKEDEIKRREKKKILKKLKAKEKLCATKVSVGAIVQTS